MTAPHRTQMTRFPLQLPRAPLRSSMIRIVVSCLAVILLLAPVVASWTMSGADYIRRCLLFFVAAAILVVGRVSAHHPFPRFGAANSVTLLRVAFVAGVAGLIGEAPDERIAWLAVATVVVVAALDGVDGWLARRDATGQCVWRAVRHGNRRRIDPDPLGARLAAREGRRVGHRMRPDALPFVAAGWVLPWMAAPLRSTMRGKSVAIGQFVGLSVALLPVVKRLSATSSPRSHWRCSSGRLPWTSRGLGATRRPGPVPRRGAGPALWTRRSALRFLSGTWSALNASRNIAVRRVHRGDRRTMRLEPGPEAVCDEMIEDGSAPAKHVDGHAP